MSFKTDEYLIENDGFLIENDGFCIILIQTSR